MSYLPKREEEESKDPCGEALSELLDAYIRDEASVKFILISIVDGHAELATHNLSKTEAVVCLQSAEKKILGRLAHNISKTFDDSRDLSARINGNENA